MQHLYRDRVRAAALLAPLLALTLSLVAGCGGEEKTGGADKAVPKTASGSLEELAAKTECRPDVQIDADELRQGICKTSKGRWVLTTFSTEKGKQEWLSQAKDYGGFYLVGKRWISVGTPEVLDYLHGRLGGDMQTGDHGHQSGGHSG